MLKFWLFLILISSISANPVFSQNQTLKTKTDLAFYSNRFFGLQDNLRSTDKGTTKFNLIYGLNNFSSQLSFSYDGYKNSTFDGSYLQYTKGIATYGLGTVNRHWSLSKNESLILSHNARPSKSIFLKLRNKFRHDWLHPEAKWSFEFFNGFTEGSLRGTKSMLTGARAILSPREGLDFELVQTSQWGGDGYNKGISALGAALFFDTNNSTNSNINKMAGFGISYLIPSEKIPLRIYGQAIGEDESGNLPSCYTYLAGFEFANTEIKYPTMLSIEAIDTRVDTSTNGHCGPNTMYNNSTYDYTNYGQTMGATLDTEGTSLGLYLRSQISQKINIKFSTRSVVINDSNWSGNRLSSKRQSGLVNSLSISWVKNNIQFNGILYNQGFNLDKANIESGYGVGFSSSMNF